MDTKRVIIATALSLAVIIAWTYFFPSQQPVPQRQTPVATSPEGNASTGASAPTAGQSVTFDEDVRQPAAGRRVTVRTPLYTAVINARGGVLERFELENYRVSIAPGAARVDLVSSETLVRAPLGLIWNSQPTWSKGQWSFEGSDLELGSGQSESLTFACDMGGVRLIRVLTFRGDSYLVDETVTVRNPTPSQVQGRLAFTLASKSLTSGDDRYNQTRVAYLADTGLESEGDVDDLTEGLLATGEIDWGAIESNYFLMAIAPSAGSKVFKARFMDDLYRVAIERDGLLVDPGGQTEVAASYYLGPKKADHLQHAPNNLARAIDYGFFDVIAKPLLLLLDWLYSFVGNYGVAIILLTVIIKILFWPLSHKSYKSMNQMKKIQPMMAKLREKYGDDRQRLNQELMQLYKTYKVNPMGGCLPMLLQIPVFIGLYQALLGAIELRHAPFIYHLPFTDMIWLADLSAKDPFYITPLVMGATMFLQQKLTPSPGDPTQAKIMLFMPIVFTFMFLNFPAGLVVYWLVNNVLSIVQQWALMKKAS